MVAEYVQLGSGQKVRLVLQVIGKDGPIPNPNNIRYLAEVPKEFADLFPLLRTARTALRFGMAGVVASGVALTVAGVKVRQAQRALSDLQPSASTQPATTVEVASTDGEATAPGAEKGEDQQ